MVVTGRWFLLRQGTEFTDAAAFCSEVDGKGKENRQ